MILDWIVYLGCGGGIVYCYFTMPKPMIIKKHTATEPKGSKHIQSIDGASAKE